MKTTDGLRKYHRASSAERPKKLRGSAPPPALLKPDPRVCEACGKPAHDMRYGCATCAAMLGPCCHDETCAKCGGPTEENP